MKKFNLIAVVFALTLFLVTASSASAADIARRPGHFPPPSHGYHHGHFGHGLHGHGHHHGHMHGHHHVRPLPPPIVHRPHHYTVHRPYYRPFVPHRPHIHVVTPIVEVCF